MAVEYETDVRYIFLDDCNVRRFPALSLEEEEVNGTHSPKNFMYVIVWLERVDGQMDDTTDGRGEGGWMAKRIDRRTCNRWIADG